MEFKIKDKTMLLYIFMIVAAVLLISHLSRYLIDKPIMIGEQSFYHTRISDEVLKGNLFDPDSKIYSPRPLLINPYHFVLVPFELLFSEGTASALLSFILGIISVILFYLILKEFNVNMMVRFLTLLILTLSPIFIFTFTVSNPNSLAVTLTLLGCYLFLKEKRKYLTLSVISFVL